MKQDGLSPEEQKKLKGPYNAYVAKVLKPESQEEIQSAVNVVTI
jgi:hypothetical protein